MRRSWGAKVAIAFAVVTPLVWGCAGPSPGGPGSTTTTTASTTTTVRPATTVVEPTSTTASTTTTRPTTTTAPPDTTTTTGQPGEVAGLTNPAALTAYLGPATITGGTVVIQDKLITGRLTVEGGNVTIRNSRFAFEDWYHLWVKGGTVLVEHSEFDGLNTATMGDDSGIAGGGVTVRWSRFRHLVNGMNLSTNSTAEHNVIDQPNTAYQGAHSDGIEIYSGSDVVVRSNQIDVRGGEGETGCVNIATDFGDIHDVLVEGNDMTGGTATLYVRLQGQGSAVTGVRVRNNRWHSGFIFHPHSIDPLSAIVEWTGNTLDGQPLTL